ncbi:DUF6602 domain-containing protein [Citrobacter youngae]
MNNNPVKHPTLIGNMYEGATKKILKKIDFSHPDLKVVSGIITSGDNHSGQIDCMVVIGEGERITNTDDFFYPIDKVGNDSNLLIVFYVQIMPDDFVMQLHRF